MPTALTHTHALGGASTARAGDLGHQRDGRR
jgi:hypothetical protein